MLLFVSLPWRLWQPISKSANFRSPKNKYKFASFNISESSEHVFAYSEGSARLQRALSCFESFSNRMFARLASRVADKHPSALVNVSEALLMVVARWQKQLTLQSVLDVIRKLGRPISLSQASANRADIAQYKQVMVAM